MNHPKIYEGREILDKLSESYFNSFQAKMYVAKEVDEWDQYKIPEYWFYYPDDIYGSIKSGFDTRMGRLRIYIPWNDEKYNHWPTQKEWLDTKFENGWYIVTIYNKHHQQFLNPCLMVFNFNCDKKELLVAWRYDQYYPGYPYHIYGGYAGDNRIYNAYGEPGG